MFKLILNFNLYINFNFNFNLFSFLTDMECVSVSSELFGRWPAHIFVSVGERWRKVRGEF